MRKNRIFSMLSGMALLLAGACSNDDVVKQGSGNDPEPGRDGVYMTVILDPNGDNGTRSETNGPNSSSSGIEVGSAEENAVKKALIVIADNQNNYITHSIVPGNDVEESKRGSITAIQGGNNPLYQTVAKFDKTDLATYYENVQTADLAKINVFVFCNPTSDLVSNFDNYDPETATTNWYDFIYTISESDMIWETKVLSNETFRGFTMSNISIAPRLFPNSLDEWAKYSLPSQPFKLSGINEAGTSTEVDNLTNGGSVKVHRMAARIDFRDGSQVKVDGKIVGNGIDGKPFTYAVVDNKENKNIVMCELIAMGLTNISKTQYYLGRVSNNGLPTGSGFKLCGAETVTEGENGKPVFNYVVSTNAVEKQNPIKPENNPDNNENIFGSYFLSPFFSQNGLVSSKGDGWDWKKCDEVVKGRQDNYGDKSYHVWRYLTENTIPAPADNQINCWSTGVVFKSRLLPTTELNNGDEWEKELFEVLTYADNGNGSSLLSQNPDTDPILYSLAGNTLYVSWENVRDVAMTQAGFDKNDLSKLDRKNGLYKLVFGVQANGLGAGFGTYEGVTDNVASDETSANSLWIKWDEARKLDADHQGTAAQKARKDFKIKATSLGFTLYQSSLDDFTGKWGYYCYYYYWNRHNDNNSGAMGPMEFAVVRNNVYKLSVVSLKTLGHPRIPENDPDDPKPDTPDEKSEVYMSVQVEVLPWVVRVNDIHF